MPGPHAHWMYYQTWLLTSCMLVTVVSHASCSFVYLSRTVWVGFVHRRLSNTMSTCKIINRCKLHALAKTAKLWRDCSLYFTRVAVYLVVQMDLSRSMVACCGQLAFHWTLNHWRWPSRWANHAITRQQCIDSKICRIELEDIVTLDLCWSFWHTDRHMELLPYAYMAPPTQHIPYASVASPTEA